MKNKYKLKSEIWVYPATTGAWYFINVNKKAAEEIKKNFSNVKRGFGSIPVSVTIGRTKWKTSIFPDTKTGTYLLPVKASVRNKEGIRQRDTVQFVIEIKNRG